MAPVRALRIPQRGLAGFALSLLCLHPNLWAGPEQRARPSGGSVRGEVTISSAEYAALIAAAEKAQRLSADQAAVRTARFWLTVEGETAAFREDFTTFAGSAGWSVLPISEHSFAGFSFSPPGRGFLFESQDHVRLAMLGPGPGSGMLKDLIESEIDGEGRRSFSIGLPYFPAQRGSVQVPGVGLEIEIEGGSLLSRIEIEKTTRLEVAGRAGATFTVRYRPRTREAQLQEAPLEASAAVYAKSEIAGGNLATDLFAIVSVRSGTLPALDFTLPEGSRLVFLRGAGLVVEEPSAGRVRAIHSATAGKTIEAHLRVVRPITDEGRIEVRLPRLELAGPVDLYSEFRPPPDALAELVVAGSSKPVDPQALPTSLREKAADAEELLRVPAGTPDSPLVYRIHRLDPAQVLTAQVRSMRGSTLVSRSGRALSRIEYDVFSSAKAFLSIHLPEGARVWGAEVSGRPIRAAAAADGTVAIPLRSGRSHASLVVLELLLPIHMPEGRGVLEIPMPATSVPVSRLQWSLSLPGDARYRLHEGDYEEGTGAAATVAQQTAPATVAEGELSRKAREALKEEGVSDRPPVAPRFPNVGLTISARAELPAATARPIRVDVEPEREKQWQ